MTADERLAQIRPKVEWAEKHIENVNLEISSFIKTNPYKISAKRDPQSRKLIYYVSEVMPVPLCVALGAGDAVQNLMGALDHLAYQLVCAATHDAPPNPNWIYFPIQDDATKYDSKKMGKIEGARQSAVNAIDAIKPYKGGNDLLWALYRLNNIEKHRTLFTVGSMFQSMDIAADILPMVQDLWDRSPGFVGYKVPAFELFMCPKDSLFPLKVGDELYSTLPDAKVNENMKFRFDVALSEPEVIQAQSLTEFLVQLSGLVKSTIDALTPELV